ncbi:hypothetical protein SAMN04244548_03010 [Paracoccus pantotrophus]|nr:hypothetical protein SAMN04244548_03010 [Paracoccus pantotrophus]
MATYPPVIPAPGVWADIPAIEAETDIMAIGGAMWISDDELPEVSSSWLLADGVTYPVAAGRALKCRQAGLGSQIRRMDR